MILRDITDGFSIYTSVILCTYLTHTYIHTYSQHCIEARLHFTRGRGRRGRKRKPKAENRKPKTENHKQPIDLYNSKLVWMWRVGQERLDDWLRTGVGMFQFADTPGGRRQLTPFVIQIAGPDTFAQQSLARLHKLLKPEASKLMNSNF